MKSGLACRAPRMHLYMTMLAATAAVAVAKSPRLASPYLEQLPQTLRFALVAKHQELDAESKSKPGGANRFRLEEDASIILQHVRDKVPLREIKLPSRDSVTAGTNRWKYQINKWQLDGMDELCHGTQPFQKAMPPARPADSLDSTAACKLRHELHALNLELPLEMQEELVQIHACGDLTARNKRPWTIVEDGCLLEEYVAGVATVRIHMDGRRYGGVKRRLFHLKRQISYTRHAFYQARCDPEAPCMQLQHVDADRHRPCHPTRGRSRLAEGHCARARIVGAPARQLAILLLRSPCQQAAVCRCFGCLLARGRATKHDASHRAQARQQVDALESVASDRPGGRS
jgi:hypothetical protein